MKRSVFDGILQVSSGDGPAFLTISEVSGDGVFEVICAGELRNESAAILEDELLALLSVTDTVRLNLAMTDYIASAALSGLLSVQKTADQYEKGGLILTGLSQPAMEAFEQTGLQEILLIDPAASIVTEEDLRAVSPEEPDTGAGNWILIRENAPASSSDASDESGQDSAKESAFICLPEGSFVVGRLPEHCDYVITGQPGISGSHAAFLLDQGRLYLKDLHSRNGSFVNGKKVPSDEKIPLHSGDRIRLCQEVFTVQFKTGR